MPCDSAGVLCGRTQCKKKNIVTYLENLVLDSRIQLDHQMEAIRKTTTEVVGQLFSIIQ